MYTSLLAKTGDYVIMRYRIPVENIILLAACCVQFEAMWWLLESWALILSLTDEISEWFLIIIVPGGS